MALSRRDLRGNNNKNPKKCHCLGLPSFRNNNKYNMKNTLSLLDFNFQSPITFNDVISVFKWLKAYSNVTRYHNVGVVIHHGGRLLKRKIEKGSYFSHCNIFG